MKIQTFKTYPKEIEPYREYLLGKIQEEYTKAIGGNWSSTDPVRIRERICLLYTSDAADE